MFKKLLLTTILSVSIFSVYGMEGQGEDNLDNLFTDPVIPAAAAAAQNQEVQKATVASALAQAIVTGREKVNANLLKQQALEMVRGSQASAAIVRQSVADFPVLQNMLAVTMLARQTQELQTRRADLTRQAAQIREEITRLNTTITQLKENKTREASTEQGNIEALNAQLGKLQEIQRVIQEIIQAK